MRQTRSKINITPYVLLQIQSDTDNLIEYRNVGRELNLKPDIGPHKF